MQRGCQSLAADGEIGLIALDINPSSAGPHRRDAHRPGAATRVDDEIAKAAVFTHKMVVQLDGLLVGVKLHARRLKELFTPGNYGFWARVAIALFFLSGRKEIGHVRRSA